jgi:hypothetical protein
MSSGLGDGGPLEPFVGHQAGVDGVGDPPAQGSDRLGLGLAARHPALQVELGRLVALEPLALHVTSGAHRDLGEHRSLWPGMSGAAVFAGDCLVGVVTHDPARFGTERLTAVPVAAAGSHRRLAELLSSAGVPLNLESVPGIPGLEWLWPVIVQRRPPTPAGLLQARVAVVRFGGRRAELDKAERWCLDSGVPVRRALPGGT